MSGSAALKLGLHPAKGRFDFEHASYDKALVNARRNAGDLGSGTKKMYDPETGALIGEMSADVKRGWRIDSDHVNYGIGRAARREREVNTAMTFSHQVKAGHIQGTSVMHRRRIRQLES